jgi:hypothetical protein
VLDSRPALTTSKDPLQLSLGRGGPARFGEVFTRTSFRGQGKRALALPIFDFFEIPSRLLAVNRTNGLSIWAFLWHSSYLVICARPSEKAPAPTRRTASGSGGGICLRTALSKDSVGVDHLRTLAGGSSALARGKRGDQPEHGQFYCPYHFLSHDSRGGPLTI